MGMAAIGSLCTNVSLLEAGTMMDLSAMEIVRTEMETVYRCPYCGKADWDVAHVIAVHSRADSDECDFDVEGSLAITEFA